MSVRFAQCLGLVLFLSALLSSDDAQASIVVFDPPEPVDLPPNVAPVGIDIDGGGVTDFVFSSRTSEKQIIPQASNQALTEDIFGHEFTANIPDETFIGGDPATGTIWMNSSGFLGGCASGGGGLSCAGNFIEDALGFVGVEFDIAGQTHYGWIEIESLLFFGPRRIHRWAYETAPGVGIRAGQIPEPSATALVLIGLVGVVLRRRAWVVR